MSQWILRNIALSVVLWAGFAFACIAGLEVVAFGRLEPLQYLASAVGLGIGLTVAMPAVPLRSSEA